MAWQLLDRRFTVGTVDGSGDITPGPAQTGFLDFTALTAGNDTYVVAVQGNVWSYMTVRKVGSILRPQTTHASSSGSPITFATGTATQVFSDLGRQHLVYIDGNGTAQNADPIFNSLAPATLADLKTTPLPASGKTVRYLRGILDGDRKGAFYVWDPASAASGDDFAVVVSSLSATGRWLRQATIIEIPQLSADGDSYNSSLYAVSNDLRFKNSSGAVKKLPRVESYHQATFATFAAFKAAASTKWATGDLIEIRGITAEGDIDAPMIGTWDGSSTNTTNLDYQFLRPDDISGSNPGRLSFPVPVRAVKFTNSDATPSVKAGILFTCADTVPAAITTFDDMKDGASIIVQPGLQDQVFTHSSSFKMHEARDYTLRTTDAPIQFYKDNGVISMLGGGGGLSAFTETTTLTSLKARSAGATGDQIYMRGRATEGDGGKGLFYWLAGNQSALVTADPGNGVYVPPDSDNTGASGVWARIYNGPVHAEWFGCLGDNSTDNTTPFGNALTYVGASERPHLLFGPGTFIMDEKILETSSTNRGLIIEGQGLADTVGYRTRFYWKNSSSGIAMLRIRSFQNLTFRGIFFDSGTQTSKSHMIVFEANESPALSSLFIHFVDCTFYERSAMSTALIFAKSVGGLRFIRCFDNSNKFIKLGKDSDVDPDTSNATLANGISLQTVFDQHTFMGDVIMEKVHGALFNNCFWVKTQDAAELPKIYASGGQVTRSIQFINPTLDSASITTNVNWFVGGDDSSTSENGPYEFIGGQLTSIADGITIPRGNARVASKFVANNSGTRRGVVIGANAGVVDWMNSDFSDWEGAAGRTNVVDSRTAGTDASRTGRYLICDRKTSDTAFTASGSWTTFVSLSIIIPGGKLRLRFHASVTASASAASLGERTFSARVTIDGTSVDGTEVRQAAAAASETITLGGEYVFNAAATTSAVTVALQLHQSSGTNYGTVLGTGFGSTVLIVEKVD